MKDPDEIITGIIGTSNLNIERALVDHLPSEINSLEQSIEAIVSSLLEKEKQLARLNLLNRIINDD